jgi:hypothetical protein
MYQLVFIQGRNIPKQMGSVKLVKLSKYNKLTSTNSIWHSIPKQMGSGINFVY